MKNIIILIFLISFFCSCNYQENVKLTSCFDINRIEKVKIQNNFGTFYLTNQQLKLFKKELDKLTFEEGFAAKVGSINISLTMNNIEYNLSTSSNGQYIEIPSSLINKNIVKKGNLLYFKTNGLNFDNFKNEQLSMISEFKNFTPNWITGVWRNVYESNTNNFRILAFTNDTIYSPNEENTQLCLNDFYRNYNSKKVFNDSICKITFANEHEQILYEFKRTKEIFSSDTILTYKIIKNGKTYREFSRSCNLTFKKQ